MQFFCLAKVVIIAIFAITVNTSFNWQLQINSLLRLSFLLNSLLLLLKTFNFLLFRQILLAFSINLLSIFASKFFFWQSSKPGHQCFLWGGGHWLRGEQII